MEKQLIENLNKINLKQIKDLKKRFIKTLDKVANLEIELDNITNALVIRLGDKGYDDFILKLDKMQSEEID